MGPNQVLTGDATLSVSSNVTLDNVIYTLINKKTGEKRYLGQNINQDEKITFSPTSSDEGNVTLQAEGMYQGAVLYTEKIDFKIYLQTLYGPKAVIEKSEFLGLASGLATDSFNKTGMSASLQTAQAILETGWGQRLPVDKYSGKFSYNLFGIKGSATNGSVISNTWEVYNGTKLGLMLILEPITILTKSWMIINVFC